MIGPTITRLLDARPLTSAEVRRTFDALLASSATDGERAAILVGLAAHGETAEELAEYALEMRRRARAFPLAKGDRPIDLCGSGGAPRPSYNVSTVSAFVVAAAGASVVKHGNRSARGLCGSSDLLEALGLPVTTSLEFPRVTYRKHRLAFLHAPLFHPATRAVAPARKILGIPTLFNRLGPLSNPARVAYQVVGVPNVPTAARAAAVLPRLGVRRGLAMASNEGCDEFSPRARTTAVAWRDGGVRTLVIQPQRFLPAEDRRGDWGSLPPSQAAAEAERILAGGGGARRGSVLLTSGAALWVSGRAPTVGAGVETAREALDDGRAERLLAELRTIAQEYPASGAS